MKKSAIILETRPHQALKFVITNVMTILPDDWNLQIFHGTDNERYIETFIKDDPFLNSIKSRIILANLEFNNITPEETSKLILTEGYWNSIDADIILVFQTDTILCPQSPYKIEQFEHFDYIGGYWGTNLYNFNNPYPVVMNGGVSIRRKQYMLDIIKYELEPYLKRGGNPCEDYFVSACLKNRPTVKDVLTFAIDNGYMSPLDMIAPFALHKPWGGGNIAKGHGRSYNQLRMVCPEIEILKSLQ